MSNWRGHGHGHPGRNGLLKNRLGQGGDGEGNRVCEVGPLQHKAEKAAVLDFEAAIVGHGLP